MYILQVVSILLQPLLISGIDCALENFADVRECTIKIKVLICILIFTIGRFPFFPQFSTYPFSPDVLNGRTGNLHPLL